VDCCFKRIARHQRLQESEALIQSRCVTGRVGCEALLGRSEPVHDELGTMLGDVPQHPAIVSQVVELTGPDLQSDAPNVDRASSDRHRQHPGVKPWAQPSPCAGLCICLEDFRTIGCERPRCSPHLDLVSILVSLQQLDGLKRRITIWHLPKVKQRWCGWGVASPRQKAHAEQPGRAPLCVYDRDLRFACWYQLTAVRLIREQTQLVADLVWRAHSVESLEEA